MTLPRGGMEALCRRRASIHARGGPCRPGHVSAEQRVQRRARSRLLQAIEATVLHDRLDGLHQPPTRLAPASPRLTRRTPSAAMSCRLSGVGPPTSRFTGFAPSGNHRADLFGRADARCIQHIGAGLGIGAQALGCPADPARQRRNSARATSSTSPPARSMAARAAHSRSTACPIGRSGASAAAGVLDRQRRNTGVDGRRHRLAHCLWRGAEAITEIGVQRQRCRGRHQPQMFQCGLQRNRPIRPPFTPGAAGTGRGQVPGSPALRCGRCPRPTLGARNNRAHAAGGNARACAGVGIKRGHGGFPGGRPAPSPLRRHSITAWASVHEVMPAAYWTPPCTLPSVLACPRAPRSPRCTRTRRP